MFTQLPGGLSMSVLIVQLTDLHCNSESDPVLGRVPQLAGAITAEVDQSTEAVHVIMGGDASQGGTAAQFRIAERFLYDLRSCLTVSLRTIPVELIMVPGNHDCDLSGDQSMRDLAIGSIADLLRESGFPPEKAKAELLSPLGEYFNFAERLCPGTVHSHQHPYYRCIKKLSGRTTVNYHLFNTAWMSRRSEAPGSLAFPLNAIDASLTTTGDVSICVLHHPFNWFKQPTTLRPLREKIESIGDLILTGHEHVGMLYGKEIHGSGGVQYAEGAVLQERGSPDISGFHVIRVDAASKQFVFSTYSWSTSSPSHYERRLGPITVTWEPVSARTSKIRLLPRFEAFLNDPGLPVHHRSRGLLKLSDYFTYPDMGSLDDGGGVAGFRVRGDQVIQSLIERERVVVAAPDKAGRTSFAKRLFADLHAKGYAPLFLPGGKLPTSGRSDTIRDRLHEGIRDQYDSLSPEAYEQLPQHQRVLIVDDLHKAPRDRTLREACLKDLDTRFGKILLLTNQQTFFDELLAPDGNAASATPSLLESYSVSLLLPFGFGRCEQFIRNWVALAPADHSETVDERVRQILGTVGDVLQSSAIPHHPWVILVLVQMADSPEPPVAENGSYGHLLNAIITAALNRSRVKRLPVNGMYGYLGELARTIFERGGSGIPEDDARTFHNGYVKAVGITAVEFSALIDDLCDAAILDRWNGEILFQHKYTFCFFVAWSLAQRLNDNDTTAVTCVQQLSENLFHEDSADVVVFLANLTSNRLVLDEIKKRAAELFQQVKPTDLDKDVQPINQLTKTVRKLVVPDSDPEENRRRLRDKQDDLAVRDNRNGHDGRTARPQPPAIAKEKQDAAYQGLMQFTSALRTIEILGQVLRNGAAVRKLEDKCRIADEVFLLAKRVLGFLFCSTPESLPHLITRLEGMYRHRFPELDDQNIAKEVSEHIFNLAWFSTFAIVKHVASAVGDDNLEDTFKRVLGESPSIADKLFDLAIRLDRPLSKLPLEETKAVHRETERNHIAQAVLRSLVAEHLYLYRVRDPEKQSICQLLDIKLTKRMLDSNEKNLLT